MLRRARPTPYHGRPRSAEALRCVRRLGPGRHCTELRPAWFSATPADGLGAGLAEFGGGLLFAGGLLTPLAVLAIAVVMVNAVVTHLANGFWNSRGGYEYNLLVWTAAVAVSATGAARFSFDRLIGIDDNISGLWWGVAVVALSIVVSAGTLVLGRRHDRDQTTRAADESEALGKGRLMR